jgi:hypothetical protein
MSTMAMAFLEVLVGASFQPSTPQAERVGVLPAKAYFLPVVSLDSDVEPVHHAPALGIVAPRLMFNILFSAFCAATTYGQIPQLSVFSPISGTPGPLDVLGVPFDPHLNYFAPPRFLHSARPVLLEP